MARAMARLENVVVLLKMAVLVTFAIIGMIYLSPERLSPRQYPPIATIFYSVAVTFFAYEGFRIVTNAAEDMRDPARTLPRAIMTAILLVMAVYVGIAISVFGNMPPADVIAAKDFALAEASRPIFGQTGFTIVAIAALFATASAINASLYAVTNVTYQLASLGELPGAFGEPIGHSREGLIVSSLIIVALAVLFDLSSIAAIGALSMLIVHATHRASAAARGDRRLARARRARYRRERRRDTARRLSPEHDAPAAARLDRGLLRGRGRRPRATVMPAPPPSETALQSSPADTTTSASPRASGEAAGS